MDQSPQPLYPQTDQTPPPAPNPAPEVPPRAPEQAPVPTHKPGRIISIIGLVFAFVFLAPIGLVLSIIGLVTSKKAGKADVIAILGVIFNVLGILAMVAIIGLVVVGYDSVQAAARDTKRQVDATSLRDAAATYRASSETAGYPGTDAASYNQDIASIGTISLDESITSKISTGEPSASSPDTYRLAYCGVDDKTTATGMSVTYWSEIEKKTDVLVTGTGCDGDSTTDDIQSGASDGSSSEQLFN